MLHGDPIYFKYRPVPLLTACFLVNGLSVAFHAPAATGLIVQLVPKSELQATNALLGVAHNSAVAGGAALGACVSRNCWTGHDLIDRRTEFRVFCSVGVVIATDDPASSGPKVRITGPASGLAGI